MVSLLAETLPQAFFNRDVSKPESTKSSLMFWPQLFGNFSAKQIEMFGHRVSRGNIWLLAGLSWQFKRCFFHLHIC